MKKTFLTRRNAILSPENFSWGAYALMVVLALLLLRVIAPNFFWKIATPLFQSADILTENTHLFFASFGNAAVLTRDNERLQTENVILANENAALSRTIADQIALTSTSKDILAGVIARPPESPYDSLVIGKGSSAGITTNMEVFGPGSVPVGFVSTVEKQFALVTLFSSPKIKIGAWVGAGHIPLTISGGGAGTFRASITRSAGVAVNDIVYAPGPGELPIGKVIRTDSDPSSPSVTLQIMPMLNIFSLPWVLVRDTGQSFLKTIQATSTLP